MYKCWQDKSRVHCTTLKFSTKNHGNNIRERLVLMHCWFTCPHYHCTDALMVYHNMLPLPLVTINLQGLRIRITEQLEQLNTAIAMITHIHYSTVIHC